MIVGIHRDPDGGFRAALCRYETILEHNGISHVRLSTDEPDFWERVRSLSLFIYAWQHYDRCRQAALSVIPVVERQLGVRTYPDTHTCWSYDDKIRQAYMLQALGLPCIPTWVFWERELALAWAEVAEIPVVFKLSGGAGSENVVRLDSRRDVRRMILMMFGRGARAGSLAGGLGRGAFREMMRWCAKHKRRMLKREIPFIMNCPNWQKHRNYVLFQKYLPDNEFDTRVTVIGNRAFAFRRFNRHEDFRASGSGRLDYDTNAIEPACISLAFDVSRRLRFQSMAYDFLHNRDGNPEIAEISYTYVDHAVWRCPGYWDGELKWHAGHWWPQYCQLADLLNQPGLKQPDMESTP